MQRPYACETIENLTRSTPGAVPSFSWKSGFVSTTLRHPETHSRKPGKEASSRNLASQDLRYSHEDRYKDFLGAKVPAAHLILCVRIRHPYIALSFGVSEIIWWRPPRGTI